MAFFHSHRNTVPDIDAFVDRAGIVAPRARRVEMAGKRLPALGFVAAFLVAFNVFRNADHSGLPHTQAGRVDPLTATTASFVAPEEDGADPGAGHARDAVARSSAASAVEARDVHSREGGGGRGARTPTKKRGRPKPLRPNPREGASRRERDPTLRPAAHAEFGGDVVGGARIRTRPGRVTTRAWRISTTRLVGVTSGCIAPTPRGAGTISRTKRAG